MSERYSRQELFAPIGAEGQARISDSAVTIVGCGALGSVSSEMLVRAGVGRIRIADRDFVEESNLQRQSLFSEQDVRASLPKAVAAERTLRAANSEIEVEGLVEDVTWENIESIVEGSDLIVDGTDNFETRFLINDCAVKRRRPWVYGACVGSYGLAFAFRPGETACLHCLFEAAPEPGTSETCDTAGIIAPVVHAVAAFQVAQALRLLVGEVPEPELLQVDVWSGSWRTVRAGGARKQDCPCCGHRRFEYLEGREKTRLIRLCGRNAVQVSPAGATRMDFQALSKRLEQTAEVEFNQYLMRIRVNGCEIALFRDGRSIVRGTEDFAEARALYARYIGH